LPKNVHDHDTRAVGDAIEIHLRDAHPALDRFVNLVLVEELRVPRITRLLRWPVMTNINTQK
jgi:hypothetical protein